MKKANWAALSLSLFLIGANAIAATPAVTPYVKNPIPNSASLREVLRAADQEFYKKKQYGGLAQVQLDFYRNTEYPTPNEELVKTLIKNNCWGECKKPKPLSNGKFQDKLPGDYLDMVKDTAIEKALLKAIKDLWPKGEVQWVNYYYSDGSESDEAGLYFFAADANDGQVLRFSLLTTP